ncbi:DUF368 domain-containing protein [Virgibacillus kekensis]|uniref:DUF368 domain-containing protein n=1 Tax=Virgibacillus kekensis TaxID=202261 RepID=A0ABV9DNC1_9BACI
MEWKNVYRGMVMGASDIIPGVSGGTIAVILGIYDRMITAINGIAGREWRKHLSFLVPLLIGIMTAVFLLSRVMEWLFASFPGPTKFFFLGLIFGVLPYLVTTAGLKSFRGNHFVLLLFGCLIVALLSFLSVNDGTVMEGVSGTTYALLFIAGFIASSGMILPGISGSFMLLILGVYPTIITAISNFRIDVLLITGAGVIIGILIMSKIIHYFLKAYYTATFALIIGMVLGSGFVIFPGWPADTELVSISVAAFALGLAAAYLLSRVEHRS